MKFEFKSGMRLLRLSLLLILTGPTAYGATINDVRIWQHPDYTRLVFELSEEIDHKLFMVPNPDRIVISMANAVMLPDLSTLDFTGSPVADIRSGVQANNDLHIVLEIKPTGNVSYKSFLLPADDEGGNRLVVDLYSKPVAIQPATRRSVERPRVQENRDIVIAIDAGHGGSDPGTLSRDGKIKEKNVTLAISRALFNAL